jgi:FtsP/CotA-like multicopper oxidase with cupredoxin domain
MERSLPRPARITRRGLLAGAAALASTLPARLSWPDEGPVEYRLRAAPGEARLVGDGGPPTPVWSYGSVPGPEIRVRQGERLRVVVANRLDEDTTVHWHGLRVPNAMDGVPHLTQPPIRPGESFVYEFDVPDAGTYWYHPHARSFEQVGRGLYGALIVEEHEPIAVDRDVIWVLDDWRLLPDARIGDDFGNLMDIGMGGRIGNTVTINGRVPSTFTVRSNERIRLRLINAANARIFGLRFQGHDPKVVALDGQPVEPHEPANGTVIVAPAQRVDLVIDMMGVAGRDACGDRRILPGLRLPTCRQRV